MSKNDEIVSGFFVRLLHTVHVVTPKMIVEPIGNL